MDGRKGAQEGANVSMLNCNVLLYAHAKVNATRKMYYDNGMSNITYCADRWFCSTDDCIRSRFCV